MKNYTMITRHGASKDNITAYTLISSDYQTVTIAAAELAKTIQSGKVSVANLAVGAKGIESTNGALDKYTLISTVNNQVEGVARAVILDRVEQGGKLVGYTVFTQNGVIAELNVVDATSLASKGLISNGKIRHTQDGDIVSAIGGTYPLRTIEIAKAPKGDTTVDIMYFATTVGVSTDYVGAIISCTSATEMSKLTDAISKSNAKVISEVVKVAGQSVRDSLAIQRMGANSIYGVFETSVFEKLVQHKAKISNNIGGITVSAIKYTDGEPDEATVKLDHSWKAVGGALNESEAAEAAKSYAKKIVTKFSSIKIQ